MCVTTSLSSVITNLRGHTSVHDETRTGDVARRVRDEEQIRIGDVVRSTLSAHGDTVAPFVQQTLIISLVVLRGQPGQHGSVHQPGDHAVDPDSFGGVLDRGTFGKVDQGGLGRRVTDVHLAQVPEGGDRPGHRDRPSRSLTLHDGEDVLADQERRAEVDVQLPLPVLSSGTHHQFSADSGYEGFLQTTTSRLGPWHGTRREGGGDKTYVLAHLNRSSGFGRSDVVDENVDPTVSVHGGLYQPFDLI